MGNIISVTCSTPQFTYSKEDILQAGCRWLAGKQRETELFTRFVYSSKIESRHFAIPLDRILTLKGMEERCEIFAREALELSLFPANKNLEASGFSNDDIEALIFTSCTIPSIPSLDVQLINALKLRSDVLRLPIYQHGCAGGIVGLSLANEFSKLGKNVLLVSVELCSLNYQQRDYTGANLVGSAIFSDGAASALVTPDNNSGLEFLASSSFLIPHSMHLMGYDIKGDGNHLLLDKELSSRLTQCVPGAVSTFLKSQGLSKEQIDWWLFHPGGVKVLNSLETSLNIPKYKSQSAWKVLSDNGNMSSASILFVLSQFIDSGEYKRGDLVLAAGIGPGLSVEIILLKCRE